MNSPILGVGVMYNPALREFVRSEAGTYDYLEVTSDMFWTDRGSSISPRFSMLKSWTRVLDWAAARVPLIAHNVGLSIGTAGLFDYDYVAQLRRWQERYRFAWQSDHMSYFKVADREGATYTNGLALLPPWDIEILDLVVTRAIDVQREIGVPFLLENGVGYVDMPEQDMDEAQFLNRFTSASSCSLLLDIHNLYTNAVNRGVDPTDFIDALDLTKVIEVHIAGGTEFAGMYTDSHSGACPEEVFDLLGYVTRRTPNLRGVTFEFHDSYFAFLGEEGVVNQLERARLVWLANPFASQ